MGRGALIAPPPLSARLAAVAALVPPGAPMADIGTDHGYLPTWLVAGGQVPRAVAIDDKPDPLDGARRTVAAAGLTRRVVCVRADGCAGLDGGVRTVTICGMGGASIVGILARVPATVTRVVLNPNTEEAGVRAALHAAGWRIDAERVLYERRWFRVIGAVRGNAPPPDPVDLAWGDTTAHLDRAALAALLDEEIAFCAGLPPKRSVVERLAVAVEARGRLARGGG